MASTATRALLTSAAAVTGLLAGANVDRGVLQMPAWRRVGPRAYYAAILDDEQQALLLVRRLPSGVQELYGVNTNLRTVREIQAAIKTKAEATPPGFWVNGFMFDDTKLDRPLTRKDLDEATTEHPVSVAHRGGHTTFYNSKAFELAGITAQTPDPSDGRFIKTNGELNGRVAENARDVFDRIGKHESITPEQRRDRARNGMRHMSRLFNACGLTSVHNAGTDSDHVLAYEDCRKNDELTHRVYMMIVAPQVQSAGTIATLAHVSNGDT